MRAEHKPPSLLVISIKAFALSFGNLMLFGIVSLLVFGNEIYVIGPLIIGGASVIAGNLIGVVLARRRRRIISNGLPGQGSP